MHASNSDDCTRLGTLSSARVVVSRLALGIALFLATTTTDAWAGNCDEVIQPVDTGCTTGESCDAATVTCTSGSVGSSGYAEICHRPPGCPGNARTLTVSACAIGAHLGHGDSYGACPECDSDDDCPSGEVCNLSTGICIDPNGGCDDDSDCGGGQVCNAATGTCIDPDGPCDDDSDCGGGQVCNLETGLCQDPTDECAVDADCLPPDGDACVLSAICSAGACVVTPLCDAQCERCDPEGCVSLCGNPFANGDDVINTTDALFALRAAVELEECSLCVCDVNGDGAVTATDTLMMLRQVVGLGDLFVCPEAADGEPTTTSTSTTTTTLSEIP